MKDLKEVLANTLEDFAGDILTSTGCKFFWGEIELPECLREEVEEENDN